MRCRFSVRSHAPVFRHQHVLIEQIHAIRRSLILVQVRCRIAFLEALFCLMAFINSPESADDIDDNRQCQKLGVDHESVEKRSETPENCLVLGMVAKIPFASLAVAILHRLTDVRTNDQNGSHCVKCIDDLAQR